ncbi:endonuclease/exonuclease/phosphatase family protein [Affinirhizobium pseudoryzae]|uniref:endonuclease/exonuclease/phosphatase family protein n=1 Tax=Allorhizobium pseudoryzae TaxID=379684 RepID=UPI0013E9FA57|nr:endonuclease/exonuclease/phosphatase family protein [Allorhizobium pseudoryzae]
MQATVSCALRSLLTVLIAVAGFRFIATPWILSFFYSFQFHIAVLIIAGSLVAVWLERGLVPIFQLSIGLVLLVHVLVTEKSVAHPTDTNGQARETITLLSFNVLASNAAGAEEIIDEIRRSGADVVYLLESVALKDRLAELDGIFPYRLGCGIRTRTCDLVVLSRFPVQDPTYASLSDLRQDRYVEFSADVAGKAVVFAAVHLSKPYFDDYHTEELEQVAHRLATKKAEVVLGGDFNSGTVAPDMISFLQTTGLRKAPHEPATWPVELGPAGIAIDHIYTSAALPIQSVRSVTNYGSNHFGLLARIGVRLPKSGS